MLNRDELPIPWRWLLRLTVLGCYAAAAGCFLLVGLMLWTGGVWAYLIYAENPYAHFFGGLFFLLVAHIVRHGHRYGPGEWRRLAGQCALLLFSLVFSWLAGEAALRMLLSRQQQAGSMEKLRSMRARGEEPPVKSDHPLAEIIALSEHIDLVYELKPNIDRKFGHRILRTNSAGMRSDREYALEKPPATVRILGLGDSGMFGWDVHQGEPYLAVLESNLNAGADGQAYEVLNFGVPGYNTALEVEHFARIGRAYRPDVVIIGWCVNDYQLPFFMLEEERFTRTDVSFLHVYLFRRDQVADVVAGRRMRSMRDVNRDFVADEVKDAAGMEGVRKALERIREMSREDGFRLLVSGPLKSDIRAILEELGIESFNTYEAIDAKDFPKEYQVHFMHPAAGGHAVIAGALERELARRGWLVPVR